METELAILLSHHFLSRKQYRELLALRLRNNKQLQDVLIEREIIQEPDRKEVEFLLEHPDTDPDELTRPPKSRNQKMRSVEQMALRVAGSDTTLLLLGESGVGKSRLAGLVHEHSHRRNGPFVTVSCGSIPDTLLESELFGVEKGAYTGANKSREGRFQRASGGTLFLDEIGELGPGLQVKLLHAIQEKRIEPLGSSREIEVDVRLIAATNRDLEADVAEGRFRKDLYFRLNVVPLTLPPLRERPEDVLALADFFIKKFGQRIAQNFRFADDELPSALLSYAWPGNIRELENSIERLCVLADAEGGLHTKDLPPRIRESASLQAHSSPNQNHADAPPESPLPSLQLDRISDAKGHLPSLAELELAAIKAALIRTKGSIKDASAILGVHRNTLSRKIREHSLADLAE